MIFLKYEGLWKSLLLFIMFYYGYKREQKSAAKIIRPNAIYIGK